MRQDKDRCYDSGDTCDWAYAAAGGVNVDGGLLAKEPIAAPSKHEYLKSIVLVQCSSVKPRLF